VKVQVHLSVCTITAQLYICYIPVLLSSTCILYIFIGRLVICYSCFIPAEKPWFYLHFSSCLFVDNCTDRSLHHCKALNSLICADVMLLTHPLTYIVVLRLPVPVLVGAKLSFVEPARRWAHSPSPSKAPGISYQGTMKTSVRMLKTSGGL